MEFHADTLDQIFAHDFDDLIDVRSPSEFADDHLPSAMNLPVLDDRERADVGTTYKQRSAFEARVIGAALVAKNAARHLEGPLAKKPGGWRPLVYCWHGGQRSGALATILAQIGWRTSVLVGGYKTYRRLVVAMLYDAALAHRIVLLDGNTGTAKTEILGLIAERGAQVLDLEHLASHRGSVFGAVAHNQPGQKAFETLLARALRALRADRPVVVEAESAKIGGVYLPPSLWEAMKSAPRMTMTAPIDQRVAYITRAYCETISDTKAVHQALNLLTLLQGKKRVAGWADLADAGEHGELARDLMLRHYEPRYRRAQARRAAPVATIEAENLDAAGLNTAADQLMRALERLPSR